MKLTLLRIQNTLARLFVKPLFLFQMIHVKIGCLLFGRLFVIRRLELLNSKMKELGAKIMPLEKEIAITAREIMIEKMVEIAKEPFPGK